MLTRSYIEGQEGRNVTTVDNTKVNTVFDTRVVNNNVVKPTGLTNVPVNVSVKPTVDFNSGGGTGYVGANTVDLDGFGTVG